MDLPAHGHRSVAAVELEVDPTAAVDGLDQARHQLVDAEAEVLEIVDAQAALGAERGGHHAGGRQEAGIGRDAEAYRSARGWRHGDSLARSVHRRVVERTDAGRSSTRRSAGDVGPTNHSHAESARRRRASASARGRLRSRRSRRRRPSISMRRTPGTRTIALHERLEPRRGRPDRDRRATASDRPDPPVDAATLHRAATPAGRHDQLQSAVLAAGLAVPRTGTIRRHAGIELVGRRGDRRLRPVVHVELGVQPLDVRLHRLDREVQLVGDLGVGEALGRSAPAPPTRDRRARRRACRAPSGGPASKPDRLAGHDPLDAVDERGRPIGSSARRRRRRSPGPPRTNSGAGVPRVQHDVLGVARRGPSRRPGRACGDGRRTCRTGRRRRHRRPAAGRPARPPATRCRTAPASPRRPRTTTS